MVAFALTRFRSPQALFRIDSCCRYQTMHMRMVVETARMGVQYRNGAGHSIAVPVIKALSISIIFYLPQCPVRVARRPSALQIHRRKAALEFRFLKAAVRHCTQPTRCCLSTVVIQWRQLDHLIYRKKNFGLIKMLVCQRSFFR